MSYNSLYERRTMRPSDATTDVLRISGVHAVDFAESYVEIDEYVPLRFRTSRLPVSVGYVRLGNYSTSLLELKLAPRSRVLTGLTVTSLTTLAAWPSVEIVQVLDGVPVLRSDLQAGEVFELQRDFTAATRSGEIVVYWGDVTRCEAYRARDTQFLCAEHTLVGVAFSGLSDAATNVFASHAGR